MYGHFKRGLLSLLGSDSQAAVPTYRFVRALPFISELGLATLHFEQFLPAVVHLIPRELLRTTEKALRDLSLLVTYVAGRKTPAKLIELRKRRRGYPDSVLVALGTVQLYDEVMPPLRQALMDVCSAHDTNCGEGYAAVANGALDRLPPGVAAASRALAALQRCMDATQAQCKDLRSAAEGHMRMRQETLVQPALQSLALTFNFAVQDEESETFAGGTADKARRNARPSQQPLSIPVQEQAAADLAAMADEEAKEVTEMESNLNEQKDEGEGEGEEEEEEEEEGNEALDPTAKIWARPREYRVTTIAGSGTVGFVDHSFYVSVDGKETKTPARRGTKDTREKKEPTKEEKRKEERAAARRLMPASLNYPYAAVQLSNGTIVVSDSKNHAIRFVDEEGRLSTILGRHGAGTLTGNVKRAALNEPKGLCVLKDGGVVVVDSGNHRICILDRDLSQLHHLAGAGIMWHKDGKLQEARFRFPSHVLCLPDGRLVVADTGNHCLRILDLKTVMQPCETTPPPPLSRHPLLYTHASIEPLQ